MVFRNIVCTAVTGGLLWLVYKGLRWAFDTLGFWPGIAIVATEIVVLLAIAAAVDRSAARR